MKINRKILIPLFATAMGLSAIGGIGGAVAWYQYNTKVSASYMGITTADGGILQIKEENGDWGRFANFGSASSKLHPITFGGIGQTDALPAKAYKHPHAGADTAAMTSWDEAEKGTDYYELKFQLQALKLDSESHQYKAVAADVYLEEVVIESATSNKTDVGAAVRVHISAGSSNNLYAKTAGNTLTHGGLDLDSEPGNDVIGGFAWNYSATEIDYGDDGTQVAGALAANTKLFSVPAQGLEVTVTIWLEGWQQLRNSAIWDPTKDDGAEIHFGMKLYTPKDTFVTQ